MKESFWLTVLLLGTIVVSYTICYLLTILVLWLVGKAFGFYPDWNLWAVAGLLYLLIWYFGKK